MSKRTHVLVIGAGIIGLSSAVWLQRAGYKVTIIDKQAPGEGASFGNAGVLAGFSRLPFTRFSMLKKVPKMLMDPESPLAIAPSYGLNMSTYGWHYYKSCFKYEQGRDSLTQIQMKAFDADQTILNLTGAQSFIRSEGSFALYSDAESVENAKTGDMLERQQQGVNLEFMDAVQIRDMEPKLAPFYAGGVYYPDTQFTVSPIDISRSYAKYFQENGGVIVQDEVSAVSDNDEYITAHTTQGAQHFDKLVIAAGSASKRLVAQLGLKLPLVSERGYHVMIKDNDESMPLNRPVAWLDKSVFMSPMDKGLRIAGIAEFADIDKPPVQRQLDNIKQSAKVMIGGDLEFTSEWLGSRPSTPDSVPVIGPMANHPNVVLAFGHSHIGLTLSGITGRLVTEIIDGVEPSVDLAGFSPERFS
ncbi:NAD(P)/FAD-dependent oxidoreductase [Leucothrix arctica]|uniref:Amino acid dehydrogenase n=1 Tax=Leucothrix arctica TaxID=1481894 RepID=A0A317CFZ9_9GAMM|nr:FAD-binding oxidoreductase [Leucothrix arctica]PWQ97475.1 amino acid dehydrogenase [Leucothrix arctica]